MSNRIAGRNIRDILFVIRAFLKEYIGENRVVEREKKKNKLIPIRGERNIRNNIFSSEEQISSSAIIFDFNSKITR